ncbi:hypothetical protein PFICI_12576 [Pestalotiopsis fici W106-1]|uniref:Uncharacterized protein n=1 Tax=Pestalotiopsis fici (strain W106-1 / CGMCC3.15140) TaxID=1229662 RepID=W3WR51_PESFW|nr:uncharacterized protein PFICI_12576 [Pestalotiopsis fici W106-1]ETS75632.1 hypothetical protein PFICI_12576 [Pestalotiopsis fici W106-1]
MALSGEEYTVAGARVEENHPAWLTLDHLAQVIQRNDADGIRAFLARRPALLSWSPPKWQPECGWSPLADPIDYAAACGSLAVLSELLDHEVRRSGGDREWREDGTDGEYPRTQPFTKIHRLREACSYGFVDVVQMLLGQTHDQEAEVERCNDLDPPLLLVAAGLGEPLCRPPRHVWSSNRMRREPGKVIRLLLDLYVDPEATHAAREWENVSIAAQEDYAERLGLEPPYVQDTVMTLVVPWADAGLIWNLVTYHGVDPYVRTYRDLDEDEGFEAALDVTPLHLACRYRNVEAVRALVNMADDPDLPATDSEDNLPIHWLLSEAFQKVKVSWFSDEEEHKPDDETLFEQTKACLELLLQDGKLLERKKTTCADMINAPDIRGRTPLHLAVANRKHYGLVPLLLRRGANPTLRDQNGRTALSTTLLNDDLDSSKDAAAAVVKMLLDHGASLGETVETTSDSLLHLACARWQHLAAVELLVAYGVPVNQPNQHGQLPLHVAASCLQPHELTPRPFTVAREALAAQDDMMACLVAAAVGDPEKVLMRSHKDASGSTPSAVLKRCRSEVHAYLREREETLALKELLAAEKAQHKLGVAMMPHELQKLVAEQALLEGIPRTGAVSIGRGLAYSLARPQDQHWVFRDGLGGRNRSRVLINGPRRRGLSLERGGSVFI